MTKMGIKQTIMRKTTFKLLLIIPYFCCFNILFGNCSTKMYSCYLYLFAAKFRSDEGRKLTNIDAQTSIKFVGHHIAMPFYRILYFGYFLHSFVVQSTFENDSTKVGVKQAMIPKPQPNVLFRIPLSFSLSFWQMHKKKMQMFLIFVCRTVHLK